MSDASVAGSFRDPSGFVFKAAGLVYRQINRVYAGQYDHLIESGLYQQLVDAGLLIPHSEVAMSYARSDHAYRIVRPEQIPFVSYPYEWSFSQLKDAALVTLTIQKKALTFDMVLKDASAYNIQFVRGKPMLIDTLSFELYQPGLPWVAYRQFCQHFLAPLALMSHRDVRLNQLFRTYIDGVPLDLASRLLPLRTRLQPGILLHIHLHATSQKRYADVELDMQKIRRSFSRRALIGLIDSLESKVRKLTWKPQGTAWSDYYQGDSYHDEGLASKQAIVAGFIEQAAPQTVWDLGANTGLYSRIAARQGCYTVSWDVDPGAVELNYRQMVTDSETHILPLLLDLSNPSPAIGWANTERQSLLQRATADAILALALIHHLAIANNVPLGNIATFMARLGEWLMIEFVPKSDPKVRKLLATREDIFPDYTVAGFETAFSKCFEVLRAETIKHSDRRLYLMRRKQALSPAG